MVSTVERLSTKFSQRTRAIFIFENGRDFEVSVNEYKSAVKHGAEKNAFFSTFKQNLPSHKISTWVTQHTTSLLRAIRGVAVLPLLKWLKKAQTTPKKR